MIFVGIDWSERHHDVCVLGTEGIQLARGRVPDGIEGVAELHGILATHAEEPEEVFIGIETPDPIALKKLSRYAVPCSRVMAT